MNPMPMITLSDEEKQKLVDLSQTGPELLIHRARLILAYAEGKPTLQAAMEPGFHVAERAFGNASF